MPDPSIVRVDFDLKKFRDGMTRAVQAEIPFAFAQALTALGREAQRAVRNDLVEHFTLRNKWISSNIRIDPERVPKGGMQVTVGSRLTRGNDLMQLEATGGTGRPKKGGMAAIPTGFQRPDKTALMPRNAARQLVRTGKAFEFTGRDGKPGIFTRDGKRIHKAFALAATVVIKPIWPFERVVDRVAADRWQILAAAALQRALKSRR